MKDAKKTIKDWWHWTWNDDSWQAWLVSVIIAFVLIKYALYPGIGLLFGTPLPVVAVVSGSMEHQPQNGVLCGVNVQGDADYWSACGEWYEERGISQEEFENYPFSNGFNKGDIIVLFGTAPNNIQQGDVITYHANKQYPLIHRVVGINDSNGLVFSTKGDHNPTQIIEYALSDGRYFYECYQESQGTITAAPCMVGERVTKDTPGAIAILDETNVHADQLVGRAVMRIPWLGYVKIWFVELLEAIGLARVTQLI